MLQQARCVCPKNIKVSSSSCVNNEFEIAWKCTWPSSCFMMAGASLTAKPLSIKIVKGFTKTQCVLFNLLSCADVDLSSADAMEILKPLYHILDKAWLVPVHVPWCTQVKKILYDAMTWFSSRLVI